MAEPGIAGFYDDLVEPLFALPRALPRSAWTGHIPFLHVLFRTLRPATFVELGVFAGGSLIAAATAAQKYGCATRLVGIDSWAGDRHSGAHDGAAMLASLRATLASTGLEATLIQSLFDDARSGFPPGSIDLLHIDGFHTYEAVRHDFETWRDALSPEGVVLFHDTTERRDDFGVWQLWAELKERYPVIEFEHSHGLGVLFTGSRQAIPPALRYLAEDPAAAAVYRRLVSAVSGSIVERYSYPDLLAQHDRLSLQVKQQTQSMARLEAAAEVARKDRAAALTQLDEWRRAAPARRMGRLDGAALRSAWHALPLSQSARTRLKQRLFPLLPASLKSRRFYKDWEAFSRQGDGETARKH